MFSSAEEVLSFIAEEKVEFIDVRFCDLPGQMQHFTVPAESFDADVFTEGRMFDGSSIRGFQQIHESDMQLLPDAATGYVDPFRAHKTLNLTFFVHDPLTGAPYTRDPRNIARKAQDYLRGTGIGDTAFFGPEAEFYIFDSARFSTSAKTRQVRVFGSISLSTKVILPSKTSRSIGRSPPSSSGVILAA